MGQQKRQARIIKAAFSLAEKKSWAEITLADIAAESGIETEILTLFYVSKQDILTAFFQQIRQDCEKEYKEDFMEADLKDRLFEMIMIYFEALLPYKKGMVKIAKTCPPALLQTMLCAIHRLLRPLLEETDSQTACFPNSFRMIGVDLIFLWTFYHFMEDDSEDLAKTMAALDMALTKGTTLASFLPTGFMFDKDI